MSQHNTNKKLARLTVNETTTRQMLNVGKAANMLLNDGMDKEEIAEKLGYLESSITRAIAYVRDYEIQMHCSEVFTDLAPYFDDLCYKWLKRWGSTRHSIYIPLRRDEVSDFDDIEPNLRYTPTDHQLLALIYYYSDIINTDHCPDYVHVRKDINNIFSDKQVFYGPEVKRTSNPYLIKAHSTLQQLSDSEWVKFEKVLQGERRKEVEEREAKERQEMRRIQEAASVRRKAFLERMNAQEEAAKREREERDKQEQTLRGAPLTGVDEEYRKLGYIRDIENSRGVIYRNNEANLKIEIEYNCDIDRKASRVIYYQTLLYAKVLEARDGGQLSKNSKKTIIKELLHLIKLVWRIRGKKGK